MISSIKFIGSVTLFQNDTVCLTTGRARFNNQMHMHMQLPFKFAPNLRKASKSEIS